MQIARFPANGAVALRALDAFGRFNFENDRSAVAFACVDHLLPAPGNSKWPTRCDLPTGRLPRYGSENRAEINTKRERGECERHLERFPGGSIRAIHPLAEVVELTLDSFQGLV